MSKFKVGDKIQLVDPYNDGISYVGVVCDEPYGWNNVMNVNPNKIVWAIWDNCGPPQWEWKKDCKRYKEPKLEPVSIDEAGWQSEPVQGHTDTDHVDDVIELYPNCIEFKNAIVPIKNCFRGAVVKWHDGMLGHVVGFVAPEAGTAHESLYCNFYGNHYYVKCIELEMM